MKCYFFSKFVGFLGWGEYLFMNFQLVSVLNWYQWVVCDQILNWYPVPNWVGGVQKPENCS